MQRCPIILVCVPNRPRLSGGFKSLRDSWADTTTAHGRLMLTVLGGLAEFERELIRTRTGEGRERAKARGVVLGRRPKLSPHQRREALARREAGEILTDIARTYSVIAARFVIQPSLKHSENDVIVLSSKSSYFCRLLIG